MSRAQLTSTVEQNTGGAVSPYVAGKNAVINGGMDIWQRGTSFATTIGASTYGSDRWLCGSDAGTPWTFSRQSSGYTGIQYATRVQRTAGSTSTTIANLVNAFESVNSIPYAGQTVTVSFYARAGANYSATSSVLNYRLVSGTGTDQSAITIGGSWTGSTNLINTTATLTTSWQRFTATVAVGATATQLGLWFYTAGVGTAGANDYYDITGVQLELGSVATAFSRAGGTLSGELVACQRYYRRFTAGSAAPYWRIAVGQNLNTTQSQFVFPLGLTMRAVPSFNASGSFTLRQGDTSLGTNAPTLQGDGSTQDFVGLVVGMSGGTAGYGCYLRSENTTSTYLEFSAEL